MPIAGPSPKHTSTGHSACSFAARRPTPTVHVGNVAVGSCHPIVVQSMTNTDTADVTGTVRQVAELARAGSELVRVTVNNEEAARAVPHIVEGLDRIGVHVPIIGDFHYNGHLLLTRHPDCAAALAKFRINPGQRRWQACRYQLPGDHRGSPGPWQAGPHRRQLGFARPAAPHRADGRERAAGRAARCARRDDGSNGAERGAVSGASPRPSGWRATGSS